jgi:DNA-directed RNA polymerase specialized sigma24 family protein
LTVRGTVLDDLKSLIRWSRRWLDGELDRCLPGQDEDPAVMAAFRRLGCQDQLILERRVVQGWTFAEIAKLSGIHRSTPVYQLKRALQRLRRELKKPINEE